MDERELELIDYLEVLWRWKWLIAGGTLACLLAAGLVSWALPKTYRVQATIETGDLREKWFWEVERLVARLNGTRVSGEREATRQAGGHVLAAEFKKSVLIELAMDSESAEEAARALDRTANKVVDELNGLLAAQQGEEDAKLSAVRARMTAVARDAEGVLARLRSELEHRTKRMTTELESVRLERERTEKEQALLQRHVQALRRSLDQLERAVAEALRDGEDRIGTLVLLSNEIAAKERTLAETERDLTARIPAKMQELDAKERTLRGQLAALRDVPAPPRKVTDAASDPIAAVRNAIYRLGSGDAASLEPALKKLEIDFPEQLRDLRQQAEALSRMSATPRPARLLTPPEIPRAPIRPRIKLNLAVSFAAGLLGSVLLAFFVDYCQHAKRRRGAGTPGQIART